MNEEFESDPRKLVQTGGHNTSVKAAYGVRGKQWQEKVLSVIRAAGEHGATTFEVGQAVAHLNPGPSTVGSRMLELLGQFYIERRGEERVGGHHKDMLIHHAVAPEERERRYQTLINELENFQFNDISYALLCTWQQSNDRLQEALKAEASTRADITETIFKNVPLGGVYSISILNTGYRLECERGGLLEGDRTDLRLVAPKKPRPTRHIKKRFEEL